MKTLIVLVLTLTVVAAAPRNSVRIVGGSVTTIYSYPWIVSLHYSWTNSGHRHACGGSILNHRAILTACHCTSGDVPARWRARAGSSYASSGGIMYSIALIFNHRNYNSRTFDNDISIVRTSIHIGFTDVIRPATVAGGNYHLGDNKMVQAAGWGTTSPGGSPSEQLRHVQIWIINQDVCKARYAELGHVITDNMLCSGWLDVGGRDQCQGDSGGPLYHNRVVVGVCSWGRGCAQARYPGVNARVSRYTAWIQNNA